MRQLLVPIISSCLPLSQLSAEALYVIKLPTAAAQSEAAKVIAMTLAVATGPINFNIS